MLEKPTEFLFVRGFTVGTGDMLSRMIFLGSNVVSMWLSQTVVVVVVLVKFAFKSQLTKLEW